MEFLFSLTHFCEAHGPKAILCTQARPLPCSQCDPPSPELRPRRSDASFNTEVATHNHQVDSLEHSHDSTSGTLSNQISRSSTAVESIPPTPSTCVDDGSDDIHIKKKSAEFRRPTIHTVSEHDSCASCSFTVPDEIAKQLPVGAPGSPRLGGPGSNGSPILRTRQVTPSCAFDQSYSSTFEGPEDRGCAHSNHSGSGGTVSSSVQSSTTSDSSDSCHPHEIIYVTDRAPQDPVAYSSLRAAVIRTLSSESLPRGLSSGPIVVGDSTNGYFISHVFRLPDPKARGRRRQYAFIALAGPDGHRALRAFPIISAAFHRLAEKLIQTAERHHEEQRLKEERAREAEFQNKRYTPVSSFLTQRVVDADGLPRRVGQTVPQSLAEITGNPKIFAEIHAEFCLTLFVLGKGLKMLPRTESPISENLLGIDDSRHKAFRSQVEQRDAKGLGLRHTSAAGNADIDKLRDLDTTPTPSLQKPGVESAFARLNVRSPADVQGISKQDTSSSSKPCTPLALETQRKPLMV